MEKNRYVLKNNIHDGTGGVKGVESLFCGLFTYFESSSKQLSNGVRIVEIG